jgi:hypothetical protein
MGGRRRYERRWEAFAFGATPSRRDVRPGTLNLEWEGGSRESGGRWGKNGKRKRACRFPE